MVKFAKIEETANELRAEWRQKVPNFAKCHDYIIKIKEMLTEFDLMPTTATEQLNRTEVTMARDILEFAVLCSIKREDIHEFERNMAELKPYYYDYRAFCSGESAFIDQILGLNLLFLLSQNRLAEFHAELELIPFENLANRFIRHPLALEQYLMEGCYNKIFLAKENVPSPYYDFFMNILIETTRNDIANCIDKACEKITVEQLMKMLYMTDQVQLSQFIHEKNWTVGNNYYIYLKPQVEKEQKKLPDLELFDQTIEYARQLEMIV